MGTARIQIQDVTGNWITVGSTLNQAQLIFRALETTSRIYKRVVRAVDKEDNLLQLR